MINIRARQPITGPVDITFPILYDAHVADRRIPAERRWPDPLNGPWTIRLHFKKIAGREECVGFEIWGGSPDDARPSIVDLPSVPLRAIDVRRPPFAELVDAARRSAVEHARRLLASEDPSSLQNELDEVSPLSPEVRDYLQQRVASFADGSTTGRPRLYGPEHFNEVAAVYRLAWAETGKPLVAIAEQWSVSKSAAAKWVARCREMKLLPETERGVPRIEGDNQ
jgi:hypothetical protein